VFPEALAGCSNEPLGSGIPNTRGDQEKVDTEGSATQLRKSAKFAAVVNRWMPATVVNTGAVQGWASIKAKLGASTSVAPKVTSGNCALGNPRRETHCTLCRGM